MKSIINKMEDDIVATLIKIPKSTPELIFYYEGKFNGAIQALALAGQITLEEYITLLNRSEKLFDEARKNAEWKWG